MLIAMWTSAVAPAKGSPALGRVALACALLLACDGCGGAARGPTSSPAGGLRVVHEQQIDPRLQEWTVRTRALPGETRVRVLLPTGYGRHPRRRYPVLYLLHGCCDDYRAWTTHGDAEAITAGFPLIVVMPDGGRMGWYTDWYRAGRRIQPEWETYHVRELIPWVDGRFRTIRGRGGRAIAGLSMGGFGALSYAGRHPGLFAAAASFSGALEIGSAAAWGSRSAHPARWRAHLPIELAPHLRSLALIELRSGNGRPGPLDEPGLSEDCKACRLERLVYPMNVRLHNRLRRLGIRHVWDDYGPGTHVWPYWERDLRETLADLMKLFVRPRG
jgi:diacylglycerol O-acyltransferase / trehalose O-mycolyltransferase